VELVAEQAESWASGSRAMSRHDGHRVECGNYRNRSEHREAILLFEDANYFGKFTRGCDTWYCGQTSLLPDS